MTKYLVLVVALRFLAASADSYHATQLDLGKNIEDCAKKNTATSVQNPYAGSCECQTAFEPSKVCIFPIHKDRITLLYGAESLLKKDEAQHLKLTGKTKAECRLMVGQAEGLAKCNIMYAAYACTKREHCDDGDCQVFCGFYPKMTDGVTLMHDYTTGVQASIQGAWGFVEDGITCEQSTPLPTQTKRTGPHDVCAWTTAGGDQQRNSMKWGAEPSECCNVRCKKKDCGEGKMRVPDNTGSLVKALPGDDCCEPCPGYHAVRNKTACDAAKAKESAFVPYKWVIWKRYSKCKKTPDATENECVGPNIHGDTGKYCGSGTKNTNPVCQSSASKAGHSFMMAKALPNDEAGGSALQGDCYSVNECTEFETGLKDNWFIYTRLPMTSIEGIIPRVKEGGKCSAFNTNDCVDGLVCDNSKNVDTDARGEGVCKSNSTIVEGNNCLTLAHQCYTFKAGVSKWDGYENCQVENVKQCSPDYACSTTDTCNGAPSMFATSCIGTCQKCATLFQSATGVSSCEMGASTSRRRVNGFPSPVCHKMHHFCPSLGRCTRKQAWDVGPGVFNMGCWPSPVPKTCQWEKHGVCWVCPMGFAIPWSSRGVNKYCSAKNEAEAQMGFAHMEDAHARTQCSVKCESGFSYALTGGISDVLAKDHRDPYWATTLNYVAAPLPDHVKHDCPAGYEQIPATRPVHDTDYAGLTKSSHADKLRSDGSIQPGLDKWLVFMEYKQGCCKKIQNITAGPTIPLNLTVGQEQVTTIKDISFTKMNKLCTGDAPRDGGNDICLWLVLSVCELTEDANPGRKCTGVVSSGTNDKVIVTTRVPGVLGRLDRYNPAKLFVGSCSSCADTTGLSKKQLDRAKGLTRRFEKLCEGNLTKFAHSMYCMITASVAQSQGYAAAATTVPTVTNVTKATDTKATDPTGTAKKATVSGVFEIAVADASAVLGNAAAKTAFESAMAAQIAAEAKSGCAGLGCSDIKKENVAVTVMTSRRLNDARRLAGGLLVVYIISIPVGYGTVATTINRWTPARLTALVNSAFTEAGKTVTALATVKATGVTVKTEATVQETAVPDTVSRSNGGMNAYTSVLAQASVLVVSMVGIISL